jgi:hypothetical protein
VLVNPQSVEREVFASLTLVKQRLRLGQLMVEVFTPATLNSIQEQILDRLGLTKPAADRQPTITPIPLRGAENESR